MEAKKRHWQGWYFDDEYLVSPQGDKTTELAQYAFFFWRQMREYKDILFKRPKPDD